VAGPPLVVSASRRTDLPAFHARWFAARLRAGFCHWRHPFTGAIRRVSLRPADLRAIVFWTRWPVPLLDTVGGLREDGVPLVFQFTLTDYGPPLESHVPRLGPILRAWERLARCVGPEAIGWRYDPIVLDEELTAAAHEARFAALAERLQGLTRRCTVSFVDFYGKTERNLARVAAVTGRSFQRPEPAEKRALLARLAPYAAERGIRLLSCCDDDLVGEGIGKARCVDPELIAALRARDGGGAAGGPEELPPLPLRPTRPGCGCAASVDIGAYDTCVFGCAYCYAVSGRETARRRLRRADPADTLLARPPALEGVDPAAREDPPAGPGGAGGRLGLAGSGTGN
jgi:hypothetical protein